ncbi:hypothetical protein PDN74_27505, partial [Bacillus cereus]|nr:hypothetical protein [Bacillus cereus]
GSVQGAKWYEGAQWERYELTPAGNASASGDITAVSRHQGTLEVWWIGANRSVQGAFWYEGAQWKRYELTPAGNASNASTSGGITAVSRHQGTMEVWWIGANRSVQGAFWYEGAQWKQYELALAGNASTIGGITAASRHQGTLEVWWIGANGSVQGAKWYEGAQWERYELAPPPEPTPPPPPPEPTPPPPPPEPTPPPPPAQGYSKVFIYNCHTDRRAIKIWVNDGSGLHEVTALDHQYNDYGSCPAGEPYVLELKNGLLHHVVCVDVGAIGCGVNDPTQVACQRYAFSVVGNSNGAEAPPVVVY